MRLVPLAYPVRSLFVRRGPTLFAALGIGLTVAVLAGVLALDQGFQSMLVENGRDDLAVFVRQSATSEGESLVRYPDDVNTLRARAEIAADENGVPLAAAESYLGVNLEKNDGSGTTIVTVRGVEEMSFRLQEHMFRILPGGRRPVLTADEVVVGAPLAPDEGLPRRRDDRLQHDAVPGRRDLRIGGRVRLRDLGRGRADHRGHAPDVPPARDREDAPGTDMAAFAASIRADKLPVDVKTERAYFVSQTSANSVLLSVLATILTTLMGAAAVIGALNTMLAAVGGRTREVGVLVALGYRRFPVFLSFLIEAALIGVVGGTLGCLLVLPLNGVETSTTNWNTFTEAAFAFRVTAPLLGRSLLVAVVLGLIGGTFPAWRASRLLPTAALRRM